MPYSDGRFRNRHGMNHPRPGRSWRRPVREHQSMAHPKRMLEQASPRPNPIERVVRKDGTQPRFFIEVAHRVRVDHSRPPWGPGPRGGQQVRRGNLSLAISLIREQGVTSKITPGIGDRTLHKSSYSWVNVHYLLVQARMQFPILRKRTLLSIK